MQGSYTIAVAGASGFVGRHLQKAFENIVVLKRDDSVEELIKKLNGVNVVVNLAGAPIIKRWSRSYKEKLYRSRVDTTHKLVNAINQSEVDYFISTSAIGIYPSMQKCDEYTTEYANDFLAKLCIDWEKEAQKCTKATAILRFGVVLGKDGGALKNMLIPFKLGFGGPIGNGKMVTSWIHIDDLINIYRFLIKQKTTGIFNAVSPNPITNYNFTKALGNALHRPTFMRVPIFMLKLIFGEGASVLIDSKDVYPKRIESLGFNFRYIRIDEVLGG